MDAIIKAIIVACAVLVGLGSTLILKLKHDNPIEEVSEAVIKEQSGVEVDLTPDSPEKE